MDVMRKAAGLRPVYAQPIKAFYIAARYGRKAEAAEIAEILINMGHIVRSTWIYQVEDEMLYKEGPEAAGQFAFKDLDEIRASDILLYLSEKEDNPWGRGGRHVEFGYALGLDKLIWVIGPLENIFHYLSNTLNFQSADDFFAYMKE